MTTLRYCKNLASFFIGMACALLYGCSSTTVEPLISFHSIQQYDDGTEIIAVTTHLNNDSIVFGQSRLRESIFKYVGRNGDSLQLRLWYPPEGQYDPQQLMLFIPGYGASSLTMFPMGLASTRRNIVTGIVTLRGSGLNARHNPTFGLQEHEDVVDAIRALQRTMQPRLKVAIFGVSLGGVVAVNAAAEDSHAEDPHIVGIALEGLPWDLQQAASRALSGRELAIVEYVLQGREAFVDSLSPKRSIPRLNAAIPLLAQWGGKDEVVTTEDQKLLREALIKVNPTITIHSIDSAGHTMRLGWPLPQQQAVAINEEIITTLQQALSK